VRRNYVRGYWGTPKSPQRRTLDSARDAGRCRAKETPPAITLSSRSGPRLRQSDHRRAAGSRVAAAPLPEVWMRKIQEWMGHRDYRTTLIYANYEPG
jgi:integrase